jgi:hypothetical protein
MPEPFRPPADLDAEEESFLRDYAGPLTALRRATAACPPVVLIQAAASESLPADEQRQIAAHIAACDTCRALMEASADPDIVEASTPSTEERSRIWSRVVAGAGSVGPTQAMNDRGFRYWAPLALAATFLLTTVILGAWAIRLRDHNQQLESRIARVEAAPPPADMRPELDRATRRAADAEQQTAALQQRLDRQVAPQVNVTVLDLDPMDAARSRDGATPAVKVPQDTATVAIVLNSSTREPALPHALEIRDAGGRVIWQGGGLRQTPHRAFTLTVPRELLPAGAYRLQLFIERGGRRELVETYALRIE